MSAVSHETKVPADMILTGRVKAYATSALGADLVGVANIERFAHAPLMMSPQGLMPSARSVVVMAIHHPDAAVEQGGKTHPQEIGPYRVQYWMNSRLDEMSYRLARYLEQEGWQAMPIVSSNIWRYKGYKQLTEHFAPDVSHRHTAVAAGIADFGYSALAITPEYGARQRFVTVITDAVLDPTPLLDPHSVCDDCRLCVDHCMSGALSKEIAGTSVVRIEGREYTYADKNLWRCAWGEHFDLDLDLDIPDKVDEEVILKFVCQHGRRGGEFGSCLRYCVPEPRRYFDAAVTDAPRRAHNEPDTEPDRVYQEAVLAIAARWGADFTVVTSAADLRKLGIEPETYLPGAQAAVTIGLRFRAPAGGDTTGSARHYLREMASYDMCRALERVGYDAVGCTDLNEGVWRDQLPGTPEGWVCETTTLFTTAPLPASPRRVPALAVPPVTRPAELRRRVERLVNELEMDALGVAPAERVAALRADLAEAFEGAAVLVARDKSGYFQPYDPVIEAQTVKIRTPEDHLAGAKSVLVLGLRLPQAAVERTALPPAEAVGPYAFAQYEAINLLRLAGYRVIRLLEDQGYRAALTFDLCGTGSMVGNPRGEQPDVFCNRFAAVAAGLGRLSRAGFVVNGELGPNVRYVAIVTDAELPVDTVAADDSLVASCADCRQCLDACHTAAFGAEVEVTVDGVPQRFAGIDRLRCDWAKRYSLIGEEGVNYLGWDLHLDPPEVITLDALADGLRQQPAIPKYRPCNFEACLMACPMAREPLT